MPRTEKRPEELDEAPFPNGPAAVAQDNDLPSGTHRWQHPRRGPCCGQRQGDTGQAVA